MSEAPTKLYILARRDLSCAQRVVQSCHALAELLVRHGRDPQVREWAESHRTLVILGVEDERELDVWERMLRRRDIVCEHFVEPDMGDRKTALAIHPSADGRLFRRLRLL